MSKKLVACIAILFLSILIYWHYFGYVDKSDVECFKEGIIMLNYVVLNGDTPMVHALMEYFEQVNRELANVRQWVRKEEFPVFIKEGSKIIRLAQEDILYLEGFGDYVRIYTTQRKPVLSQISLKRFEEILDNRYSCRIHRSYIVSIRHINYIEHKRMQIADKLIPISNSYFPELLQHLSVQE